MSGSGRTIPIGAAELRAIRERESVLEQTLARLTGIDMTTVERIEKGETPLTTLEPDQIRQWAKTLGVNPARLTGETPQTGEDGTTVIRRMRTERGWSCPQLAEHANVPYRSLRQYDSGERDTANMAAGILAASPSRSTPAWKSSPAGPNRTMPRTIRPPDGPAPASPGTGRDKGSARPNSPSGPDRPRRPSEASRPAVGHRQQTQPHHPRPRRRSRHPGARPHGPNTGRKTTHERPQARENGTFGHVRRPRLPQPRERRPSTSSDSPSGPPTPANGSDCSPEPWPIPATPSDSSPNSTRTAERARQGNERRTDENGSRENKEAGRTVPTAFPASFIPWGATPFTPGGAG